MLALKDYNLICSTSAELMSPANLKLRPELRAAIGERVGAIFPDFEMAFPLTTKALESYWPKPVAAFRQFRGNWQPFLVLPREDLNLFFELTFAFEPIAGPDFDKEHSMLPPKWRELYRFFESFLITADSVKPMDCLNTPFSYSGRLSLDELCRKAGADKAQARTLRKNIDSKQLCCWLLTEAGDALLLDEERCDHKIYHVRIAALDDVVLLEDPELLDKYLAHYVSGGLPVDFDFRSSQIKQQ